MTKDEFWGRTEAGDWRTIVARDYRGTVVFRGVVKAYTNPGYNETTFHLVHDDRSGPLLYSVVESVV